MGEGLPSLESILSRSEGVICAVTKEKIKKIPAHRIFKSISFIIDAPKRKETIVKEITDKRKGKNLL